MAMIDHVVFFNMIEKGGANIGDIFLPAVGNPIEDGRGIMDGLQEFFFRNFEILGSLEQNFSANAFISEYLCHFFSNLLAVAKGSP